MIRRPMTMAFFRLLFVVGFFFVAINAAHSRRRIVVRESSRPTYDRSITTFDPDGRLLQVEYGLQASQRGATVLALFQQKETMIVLVQGGSFGKCHRLDHHLWLFTSGLSGDARLLAQVLRQHAQDHRVAFGEVITSRELAKVAAQLQHQLTRTGGARPLGCSALIVGVDTPTNNQPGKVRLFQTDPGGIVEQINDFGVIGKQRVTLVKELSASQKQDKDSSVMETAAALAKKVFNLEKSSDKTKGSERSMLDIWVIQPHVDKRGGLQATCYRNVDEKSLSLLQEMSTDS